MALEFDSIPGGGDMLASVYDLAGGAKQVAFASDLANYEPLLPTTPADPQNKFLNGNKLWSEILIGSGGYAANLYLTTVDSTDVAGYEQVSYINDVAETTISQTVNASEELMVAYLFEQAIATTTIDSGAWRMSLFGAIDAAAGDSWFKFEVFVRHTDTTETVLFSQYSATIENRVGYEGYQRITIESVQPLFTVLSTDRLGIKIYAKTTATGDRTLSYVVGDGNASYINTPLALRHNQLRGLNDDTNYLHVTSTEKSTWNGKQDALGFTPLPLAGGTMSGNIQLGENTSIDLDPAGSADGKYTGICIAGIAGATIAFGDLVYLASSGKWVLTDADASATGGPVGIGMCVLGANDTEATKNTSSRTDKIRRKIPCINSW